MHQFPIDVNVADKHMLLRVPGIVLKSVAKIIAARRFSKLNWDHH
jgi:predicted DNA-binding helix-hairpin-helix protein